MRDLLGLAESEQVEPVHHRATRRATPPPGSTCSTGSRSVAATCASSSTRWSTRCASAWWRGWPRARPWTPRSRRRHAGCSAIDPTRLGAGGLRLQLELALLEPAVALAAAAAVRPAAAARRSTSGGPPAAASASAPAGRARAPPPRCPAPTPAARSRRAPRHAGPRDGPAPTPRRPRSRRPRPGAGGARPRRPRSRAPGPHPPAMPPAPTTSSASATAGSQLVAQISDLNRGRPAADQGLPADRGRGQRRHPRLPGGEGVPQGRRRAAPRRSWSRPSASSWTIRSASAAWRPTWTSCRRCRPMRTRPHILSEAHRIFADDLADVPEVT